MRNTRENQTHAARVRAIAPDEDGPPVGAQDGRPQARWLARARLRTGRLPSNYEAPSSWLRMASTGILMQVKMGMSFSV